ncbi:MAG: class I SAM-dependent RNA methyltransferase [Candidatus Omnitrophica bacterium]|nr:class I SAM-dependent RNA methyltransferase [Candidatus Omnitrophota bacterium]
MESITLTHSIPVERVKPLCPVFGICGGCAYQDISYEEELQKKESQLRELMTKGLEAGDNIFKPIVASPQPYFYRSRLDLTLRRRKDGFLMGFQPSSSHQVIDIESCSIARREISEFIPELKKTAVEKMPENYGTANLVVKTSQDGRTLWGGIGRRSLLLKPEDYLWTEIHGKRIFYSLDTFFQANLSILPLLMEEIQNLVRFDRETFFIDLYAGVGLFGIYFSDQTGKIAMMEEAPASISLVRHNAAYHGLDEACIHAGKVEELFPVLLEAASAERVIAMIDPPRRGLSPEAIAMLTKAKKIHELLYLSCHPDSLLRDLLLFTQAGWKIEKIVPFDFFPKTKHLETLVLLKS